MKDSPPIRSNWQSVPAAKPTPRVIPGGRAVAFINTCTSETLVALLRQLKRAYWPFRWVRRHFKPHNSRSDRLHTCVSRSLRLPSGCDGEEVRNGSFLDIVSASPQDTSMDRADDGPCGSGGGFLAAALAVLGTDDTDAATTVGYL